MPKSPKISSYSKKIPIYTKLVLSVFGFALASILVIGILISWNHCPPKAYYLISEIEPGTEREEVYEILGHPNSQAEHDDNVVYYYRPFSCYTLYVYFDDEDKYTDFCLEDY